MDTTEVCVICGNNHTTSNCDLITITSHIADNEKPSKAKLSLPTFLHLRKQFDNSYTILTRQLIGKGTKFGPLQAPQSPIPNFHTNFPLKLFPSEYYLDTNDENQCNWMIFIQFADNCDEQNLICYQENDCIYYVTIRNVCENEELKVWYSPYYAKKMNKIVLASRIDRQQSIDVASLVRNQQNITNDQWTCKFCSHIETNVILFAKHLIKHYIMQLRPTCDVCKMVFRTNKNLKSHLKIVHYQQFNQNKRKKTQIQQFGGPLLLNDVFNDNLLDVNLNQFDLNDLISQDFDYNNSDNLLLNDSFNFDLLTSNNDNNKQFLCDICLKQFTKINLLLLHLKQHTGEYFCEKCRKVFCRKENFKNHLCNLQELIFICFVCNKKFTQKKYLTRHLKLHNNCNKFICLNDCKKIFSTKQELNEHNCVHSVIDKEQYRCHLCNKLFLRKLYLKRHLKIHQIKNNYCICEICGKHLKNLTSFYLHKKIHEKQEFCCNVCKKLFHRKDSFTYHKKTHENLLANTFQCGLCDNKKFKSEKILKMHLNNYHKTDDSYHKCPICGKLIKLKSSLLRHLRNLHSNNKAN